MASGSTSPCVAPARPSTHPRDHCRSAARVPERDLPTPPPRRRGPCDALADAPYARPRLRRLTPAGQPPPHRELADGWIGNSFFPETAEVFLDPIRDGATMPAGLSPTSISPCRSVLGSPTSRRRRPPPRRGSCLDLRRYGSATTNLY